jgi:hypothetical protein
MHDAAGDTTPPQCIQMLADCGPDGGAEANVASFLPSSSSSTSPSPAPCASAPFLRGYFYTESDVAKYAVPPDLYMDR